MSRYSRYRYRSPLARWRARDRQRTSQRNKWWRAAKIVCDHRGIGVQCTVCGETDLEMLQIDHVKGDGYVDRPKSHASHGHNYKFYDDIISGKVPPEDAQVLCANHHVKKTKWEREYGKRRGRAPIQAELIPIKEILDRT